MRGSEVGWRRLLPDGCGMRMALLSFKRPEVHQFITVAQHEMSAESGWLSPSLIDSMDRIVAIDKSVKGIYLHIPLPFVAVGLDDDVYQSVPVGCYP